MSYSKRVTMRLQKGTKGRGLPDEHNQTLSDVSVDTFSCYTHELIGVTASESSVLRRLHALQLLHKPSVLNQTLCRKIVNDATESWRLCCKFCLQGVIVHMAKALSDDQSSVHQVHRCYRVTR